MKMRLVVLLPLYLASCAAQPHKAQPPAATPAATPAALTPPIAKRDRHTQQIHGRTLVDDYFWLRAKGTADVESYLKAENAYTESMTKASQPFQSALYKEMLGRVQETDATVPHRDRGWYYYSRTVEGQQYPIFCRKSAAGVVKSDLTGATSKAPEVVLLDLNQLGQTRRSSSGWAR